MKKYIRNTPASSFSLKNVFEIQGIQQMIFHITMFALLSFDTISGG